MFHGAVLTINAEPSFQKKYLVHSALMPDSQFAVPFHDLTEL
jgi:hypothetical protein